jgi:hypothetical protein
MFEIDGLDKLLFSYCNSFGFVLATREPFPAITGQHDRGNEVQIGKV